ncbi:MAG TPA: ABC transporter permease, partial [Thermomicrobiales bacterium]|nr:ABC transporter permease [Thermomicrobiales bacterium]
MLRYVARRTLLAIFTIFGVATIVFVAMRLVPGGIVEALAGPSVVQSPELVAALERKYGLDKPVIVQFGIWLGNALQGDLGESLGTRSSVSSEIIRRGGVTIELTILATVFSVVVGIPVGVFAALRRGSATDAATRFVSLIGLSIPDFVLGTMIIYLVSTRGLGLPVSGYVSIGDGLVDHIRSMILPALTLGVSSTAVVMRLIRSSVVEVLNEPYV